MSASILRWSISLVSFPKTLLPALILSWIHSHLLKRCSLDLWASSSCLKRCSVALRDSSCCLKKCSVALLSYSFCWPSMLLVVGLDLFSTLMAPLPCDLNMAHILHLQSCFLSHACTLLMSRLLLSIQTSSGKSTTTFDTKSGLDTKCFRRL